MTECSGSRTRYFALIVTGLLASASHAQQAATGTPPAPAATAGTAATSPADAQAPDLELDEVIVRGKQIERTIADAEDDFYAIYNRLNKNDDYDVNCAQVNIDPDNRGSRMTSRVCLPGFVANAVADWTAWKVRCQPPLEDFDEFSCLDRNDDERLSWQEASVRPELDARMFTLDADHNGYLTRDELPEEGMSGPPTFQPPPPELILMEGTEAWYAHMMSVIRSDPKLQEMAGELDELYRELRANQRLSANLEADVIDNRPVRAYRGSAPR